MAAYTVKLNRTNKECVQPYNPQAGSETPISLLSLVFSQAAVKDLQSLLSSTFLDNAHFGVKIVVTEEKPSLCSLHCIIASVSKPFLQVCLSDLCLYVLFSFPLHLNHIICLVILPFICFLFIFHGEHAGDAWLTHALV